jgi:peptidoglycan/LPS O-acetylase OafA/YrhL
MDLLQTPNRIDGFDYLRCFGLVLVLWQHQLSILGQDRFTWLGGLNLGQLGVSIFLAVSGILAVKNHREPLEWLLARLRTIYPAFWIATLFGFIATLVSGHKKFTIFQVLSQLAGTGLFTHGMNLINVATWFVSLLLALYLVVYVTKCFPFTEVSLFLIAIACLLVSITGYKPLLFVHAATFLLAAVSIGGKPSKWNWYLLCSLPVVLFVIKSSFAIYPAVSLCLCLLALQLPPAPALVRMLSKYSYEFYLLHGIFLVGSHKIFNGIACLEIPVGIFSSMVAAVLLHHGVQNLNKFSLSTKVAG